MKGEIYINGNDAYSTWGVNFSQQSISNLLMPPPMKSYTSNTNSSINGKEVLGVPMIEERDLTIEMSITAHDATTMLSRLQSFINDVLKQGQMTIKTKYSTDVYHMCYLSCSQLSTFNGKCAVFTLRLNEPDPSNRQ